MTKYFTLVSLPIYPDIYPRYESGIPSFLKFNFSCEKITRCQNDLCPNTFVHYLPLPNRICEPQNRPIDCTLYRLSIVTIQYKWFDLEMNSELNIFD